MICYGQARQLVFEYGIITLSGLTEVSRLTRTLSEAIKRWGSERDQARYRTEYCFLEFPCQRMQDYIAVMLHPCRNKGAQGGR